jgi:hypothetical protein
MISRFPSHLVVTALVIASGALLGFGCGRDDFEDDAGWEFGEPTRLERYEGLQTGIYEVELRADPDGCDPSIFELDAAYPDWPPERLPVNVTESQSDESRFRKSLELPVPFPRSGEVLTIETSGLEVDGFRPIHPLIFDEFVSGGCSTLPQTVAVRVPEPGEITVTLLREYDVDLCGYERWAPQPVCYERLILELRAQRICENGCRAAGAFEEVGWQGYRGVRSKPVEGSFRCDCS